MIYDTEHFDAMVDFMVLLSMLEIVKYSRDITADEIGYLAETYGNHNA